MNYRDYYHYLELHGITQATADKFGLVDTGGFKIAIPIKDKAGNLLFHKYRHLNDPNKKFTFDTGSTMQLYNSQALYEPIKIPYIIICEGEPDCIRLAQEGFTAVTGTNGATTFKEEWASEIIATKKQVIVILDNDEAGSLGTEKIKSLIPEAWVVKLPDSKDVCDYLQKHSIAEFVSLIKAVKSENTIDFDQYCQVVDKWLNLPDKNVLRVVMAGLVAHKFASDPLWLFLVAPPAGSKTEILTTISSLPQVYPLSDLTPNTMVSGMVSKTDPSLLNKLHDNVLVMKDFTTVLTMRHEDRGIILAQLREIYDGRYAKAFGTGKTISWEGRLSLIAGVTTMIDTHSSVFQVMGERFIMYRIPQPNDKQVAKTALLRTGKEKEMRSELKQASTKFFASLQIPDINQIEISDEIITALASLASFIVIARSGIIRDNYHKEINYIPTPEAPSRLAKQLGTLIKALSVTEKRQVVTWDDYFLTLRIALDIIPRHRALHLLALCGQEMKSTAQTSLATNYSRSGSEIILEDLTALELVESIKGGLGVSNYWSLSDKTYNYFKDLLPVTDGVDKYFPANDIYRPLIDQIIAS